MSSQMQSKLWKMCWVRMSKAIESGSWLEAIALEDSMLNERLESLRLYATASKSFQSLDRNLKSCLKLELADDEISVLMKVDKWRESRNHAMHRMVKYSAEDFALDWEERLVYIEECAKEGVSLVKETKNAVARAKRRL